ncbi:MAG: hypothetical protein O7C75_11280 [Verrucomicrobia bacterium]|nr:hypothetical protein [Verrucomicrobiota bacterium]
MKDAKVIIWPLALMLLSLCFISCQNYVDSVDPLIDQVEDDLLNTEANIPFLITGVLGEFGLSGEQDGVPSILEKIAAYSDEMIQGHYGGSPEWPQFVQDTDQSDLDFYERDWENYHRTRFFADDLVERVAAVDAGGGFQDPALRERALWWGNFVGGLMRMYVGEHWGAQAVTGNLPGSPITTKAQVNAGEFGAFFSVEELHAQARTLFNAAMGLDPGNNPPVPNSDRVLWSFIARTHIFDGNATEAKAAAEKGLQQGDPPLQIPHTIRFQNAFYERTGRGNEPQFSSHPRFMKYLLDDPKEGTALSEVWSGISDANPQVPAGIVSRFGRPAEEGAPGNPGHRDTVDPRAGLANQNERLPMWERAIFNEYPDISGGNQWEPFVALGSTGIQQDFFPNRDQATDLIDWREMQLILAEAAINGAGGDPLEHINNVRRFHGLDEVTPAEMAAYDNPWGGASTTGGNLLGSVPVNKHTGALGLLIEERDKTLHLKGTRIVDQRRFNLWHLPDGKFKNYMPIPRSETNRNPNIP